MSKTVGTCQIAPTMCLIRVPARQMADQRSLGGCSPLTNETGASKLPPCGAFEFETVYDKGILTTVNDNGVLTDVNWVPEVEGGL